MNQERELIEAALEETRGRVLATGSRERARDSAHNVGIENQDPIINKTGIGLTSARPLRSSKCSRRQPKFAETPTATLGRATSPDARIILALQHASPWNRELNLSTGTARTAQSGMLSPHQTNALARLSLLEKCDQEGDANAGREACSGDSDCDHPNWPNKSSLPALLSRDNAPVEEGRIMNEQKVSRTGNGSPAANKSNSIQDGIPHAPGGGDALMRLDDVVMLLLDHQSGLFQVVKDIPVAELRANTIMLAKLATQFKIPLITTASEPGGPNGPLMPEIHQVAPHFIHVPRRGEVNAWDNELFVKTVRETGRKTLIMAGVWTSVCVMFPALDATAAGYKVYAVIDASGDPSEMASRTTLARFTQAGVVPISANAVLCELQRTWNRPDAAEIEKLYEMVAPNYAAVMESYNRAQDVALHPNKPQPELTHV